MDRFNWRGRSLTLSVGRGENPDHELGAYNIDLANYCPVPLVLSSRGYGIFLHTARTSVWDLGARSPATWEFGAGGDELDYYFIDGPGLKDVLRQYTSLTGRSPLLPKPAYGLNVGTYSGGTWGHEEQAGQEYVVALARRFREERVPADVMHLDSTWRRFGPVGGRNATSFEFREGFPEPGAMFKALHDLHFTLVGLHVRPRLDNGETTRLLHEARTAGIIADTPSRNIVDFFRREAVDWWWQHAVLPKARLGADFLKTDEGSVFPGTERHNLFPIAYAKAAYQSFAEHRGGRGFNLTREGYAGIQRYPYIWAGDWPSRWKFYAPVVRAGLNAALSGIAIWGHNIGGFEEVAPEELYLRWTAYGLFTPVAHLLGMEHPRYKEPWRYGDRALATFRRYAQLRYRLMPYIYSAAHQAYADGVPMMRPLVLEYPEDRQTYDVDDQYLFGDFLMIAPVTVEGARARSVYLPAGVWFDYWTGERHDGSRRIDYPAPVETLPILVKGGGILPMQPEMAYVDEKPVDPLTLEVFPSGRSQLTLYEDDGRSREYQEGAFSLTRVACLDGPRGVELRVDPPRGSFPVPARRYELLVHLERPPAGVRLDGRALPRRDGPSSGAAPAWSYDTARRVVRVSTEPSRPGRATLLRVEK
jgi:alpha-glucosidase (family GH31 glycosyl hydrolase)